MTWAGALLLTTGWPRWAARTALLIRTMASSLTAGVGRGEEGGGVSGCVEAVEDGDGGAD